MSDSVKNSDNVRFGDTLLVDALSAVVVNLLVVYSLYVMHLRSEQKAKPDAVLDLWPGLDLFTLVGLSLLCRAWLSRQVSLQKFILLCMVFSHQMLPVVAALPEAVANSTAVAHCPLDGDEGVSDVRMQSLLDAGQLIVLLQAVIVAKAQLPLFEFQALQARLEELFSRVFQSGNVLLFNGNFLNWQWAFDQLMSAPKPVALLFFRWFNQYLANADVSDTALLSSLAQFISAVIEKNKLWLFETLLCHEAIRRFIESKTFDKNSLSKTIDFFQGGVQKTVTLRVTPLLETLLAIKAGNTGPFELLHRYSKIYQRMSGEEGGFEKRYNILSLSLILGNHQDISVFLSVMRIMGVWPYMRFSHPGRPMFLGNWSRPGQGIELPLARQRLVRVQNRILACAESVIHNSTTAPCNRQYIDGSVDSEYRSVLLAAVMQNQSIALTRTLLERGANPNRWSLDQETPLQWAARNGNQAVLALLREYGADAVGVFSPVLILRALAIAETFQPEIFAQVLRYWREDMAARRMNITWALTEESHTFEHWFRNPYYDIYIRTLRTSLVGWCFRQVPACYAQLLPLTGPVGQAWQYEASDTRYAPFISLASFISLMVLYLLGERYPVARTYHFVTERLHAAGFQVQDERLVFQGQPSMQNYLRSLPGLWGQWGWSRRRLPVSIEDHIRRIVWAEYFTQQHCWADGQAHQQVSLSALMHHVDEDRGKFEALISKLNDGVVKERRTHQHLQRRVQFLFSHILEDSVISQIVSNNLSGSSVRIVVKERLNYNQTAITVPDDFLKEIVNALAELDITARVDGRSFMFDVAALYRFDSEKLKMLNKKLMSFFDHYYTEKIHAQEAKKRTARLAAAEEARIASLLALDEVPKISDRHYDYQTMWASAKEELDALNKEYGEDSVSQTLNTKPFFDETTLASGVALIDFSPEKSITQKYQQLCAMRKRLNQKIEIHKAKHTSPDDSLIQSAADFRCACVLFRIRLARLKRWHEKFLSAKVGSALAAKNTAAVQLADQPSDYIGHDSLLATTEEVDDELQTLSGVLSPLPVQRDQGQLQQGINLDAWYQQFDQVLTCYFLRDGLGGLIFNESHDALKRPIFAALSYLMIYLLRVLPMACPLCPSDQQAQLRNNLEKWGGLLRHGYWSLLAEDNGKGGGFRTLLQCVAYCDRYWRVKSTESVIFSSIKDFDLSYLILFDQSNAGQVCVRDFSMIEHSSVEAIEQDVIAHIAKSNMLLNTSDSSLHDEVLKNLVRKCDLARLADCFKYLKLSYARQMEAGREKAQSLGKFMPQTLQHATDAVRNRLQLSSQQHWWVYGVDGLVALGNRLMHPDYIPNDHCLFPDQIEYRLKRLLQTLSDQQFDRFAEEGTATSEAEKVSVYQGGLFGHYGGITVLNPNCQHAHRNSAHNHR